MERRLLLDVVVGQRAPVFELLAREDQPLLVGRDALLVLDLGLHVLDRVARLDLERDRFASQRLHEDLHLGLAFFFKKVLERPSTYDVYGTVPSS